MDLSASNIKVQDNIRPTGAFQKAAERKGGSVNPVEQEKAYNSLQGQDKGIANTLRKGEPFIDPYDGYVANTNGYIQSFGTTSRIEALKERRNTFVDRMNNGAVSPDGEKISPNEVRERYEQLYKQPLKTRKDIDGFVKGIENEIKQSDKAGSIPLKDDIIKAIGKDPEVVKRQGPGEIDFNGPSYPKLNQKLDMELAPDNTSGPAKQRTIDPNLPMM